MHMCLKNFFPTLVVFYYMCVVYGQPLVMHTGYGLVVFLRISYPGWKNYILHITSHI